MIYLCCQRIPCDIDKEQLYLSVLGAFAENEQNFAYITKLYERSHPESSAESLYSLLLLSQMLDQAYPDWHRADAKLIREEYGKPYLDGVAWQFSISHSHGHVAVAISDEGAVGIDIERSDISSERAQRLAERYFTEDDQAIIKVDPNRFSRIWQSKEATAKLFGMPLGELISMAKSDIKKYEDLTKAVCLHEIEAPCGTVTLCTDTSAPDIKIITL